MAENHENRADISQKIATDSDVRLFSADSDPGLVLVNNFLSNNNNGTTRSISQQYSVVDCAGSTSTICTPSAPATSTSTSTPVINTISNVPPVQQVSPNNLKHSETAALMTLHNLKAATSKLLLEIDHEMGILDSENEDDVIKGITAIGKIMNRAWAQLKIGNELGYALCDYLRDTGFIDRILSILIEDTDLSKSKNLILPAARTLEECLSMKNREHIINSHNLRKILEVTMKFGGNLQHFDCTDENRRIAASVLENLFKISPDVSMRLMKYGALDYILSLIKTTSCRKIYKHSAAALANLAIYGDTECYQKMIAKNVPDWLFFLIASVEDTVTRYYACLTICMLATHKETETAAVKAGTLSLVEPLLSENSPSGLMRMDFRLAQGRMEDWLKRIIPMLYADRTEPRCIAAYHFVMEALIKKERGKLDIFQKIGAIEALKTVASSPDGLAPSFARKALQIIGEELPYKLSQKVPQWSTQDVKYWVTKVGFEQYAENFESHMVDGDLLLSLDDQELKSDIGIDSSIRRKRFLRELAALKQSADYSNIDDTKLDEFLMSINPHFSVYTYHMLELSLDTTMLATLTDEALKDECRIQNRFHRAQIIQAIQDWKHVEDMEVAILAKHIETFISYRRSSGCQLASLIKVMLQLRGHKVFLDVDRLTAGQFDTSLFKNIQAAKHFILILTAGSLDRCLNDTLCDDWVHKEISCALHHHKNLIPIFDPSFDWPDEGQIPSDMRAITLFNGVRWVHEYQEACIDKVERFLQGEFGQNTLSSLSSRSSSPTFGVSSTPGKSGAVALNLQTWHKRSRTQLTQKGNSQKDISETVTLPSEEDTGSHPSQPYMEEQIPT